MRTASVGVVTILKPLLPPACTCGFLRLSQTHVSACCNMRRTRAQLHRNGRPCLGFRRSVCIFHRFPAHNSDFVYHRHGMEFTKISGAITQGIRHYFGSISGYSNLNMPEGGLTGGFFWHVPWRALDSMRGTHPRCSACTSRLSW